VFADGQCSAACGGGQLTRRVHCVYHPVDTGGEMIVVEESGCNSNQAPPRTQMCNMSPCPPNWFIDTWSKVDINKFGT